MTNTPFRDVPYLARVAIVAAQRLLAELEDDGILFESLAEADAAALDFHDREVETVPPALRDLLDALAAFAGEARWEDGVGAEAVQRLSAALKAARPLAR